MLAGLGGGDRARGDVRYGRGDMDDVDVAPVEQGLVLSRGVDAESLGELLTLSGVGPGDGDQLRPGVVDESAGKAVA